MTATEQYHQDGLADRLWKHLVGLRKDQWHLPVKVAAGQT